MYNSKIIAEPMKAIIVSQISFARTDENLTGYQFRLDVDARRPIKTYRAALKYLIIFTRSFH